ncbi:MAG: precorrin-3B C(17)-methyltransferase [Peptostreptococcaceae bacterium]|nr:precorrin-3B C(17)-methyltransferase [Peptostreptococcaceae bacterium]
MKIYVIGTGPGELSQITPKALDAIKECNVIAGYNLYVDLLGDMIEGKELIQTPMKQEVKRCEMAIESALAGNTVAMISSGDAGVYGMAGLIYELAEDYPDLEIEVISGITAASSAGAVLGAPLIHDFAIISLSDLLTPWEKIEKRLEMASAADFVIALYNPSSMKRADYLQKACDIMMRHKSPDTKCGYVRNIGRDEEEHTVLTLAELRDAKVDMFTTVIIGNESTRIINGKLVTPRGYRK